MLRYTLLVWLFIVALPLHARERACDELLMSSTAQWLSDPRRAPDVEEYVNSLLQLPQSERAARLKALSSEPAYPGDPDFLQKLSLHHRPTWLALVEHYSRFSAGYDLVVALLPLQLQMPPGLKHEIEGKIRSRYPHAAKIHIDPRVPYQMAPKGSLDALITNLAHPFEFFRARHAAGSAAADIYQEYLAQLNSRVFGERSSFGNYTGAQVLELMRGLQQVLREWQESHPDGSPPFLLIQGSFPSGRARLDTSDLDSHLSPRDAQLEWKLGEALPANWSGRGPMGLTFSFFPEMGPGHFAWNSQVSPLSIMIKPDAIELWIFPPQRLVPHELFNQGSDARPDVYRIE